MTFQEFVGSGLPALAAAGATAWWVWARYQALEARFDAVERSILDLQHQLELLRHNALSADDALKLLTNGNRELIEHRTKRFIAELTRIEGRLGQEISEIKGFLAKSTEFKIRDR